MPSNVMEKAVDLLEHAAAVRRCRNGVALAPRRGDLSAGPAAPAGAIEE